LPDQDPPEPSALALTAYRRMVLARTLEDKISALYHAGTIVGGVYTGKGQEAFSAALGVHLVKGKDTYAPLIRDQAGRLAFGEPLEDSTRTYFGSAIGPMRGRDGNVHHGRPREGMPAMISHLGAMISVVAGTLLAKRFHGVLAGTVGAASVGEGATSTGAFHEALNAAAVERLPLVVAVANNQFAYSTPASRQFACRDLVDRAAGYGVGGHSVDGTDLLGCLDVFGHAVGLARAGEGPQLVIGSLLRLSGHGEHDDASYVPAAMKSGPLGRDCLELAAEALLGRGWATAEWLASVREESARRVQAVVAQTQGEPEPDAFAESWECLRSAHLCEGSFAPA
jgi:pyruvate dehydrogenase E1 component alpha subunit/2-oxoisovalerate dehydrogenase E1 component alpha subunit